MSYLKETSAGKVNWDHLREELLELPKETLVDMVNMWVKNYWTNQGYWLTFVERDFGFECAGQLDGEVWEKLATAQAHRLVKLLNLGNDIQSLSIVLKYTAAQWGGAGFEWEILEISKDKLIMQVNKCPMGTFRDSQNLPLLPCKFGAPNLYKSLAHVINNEIEVKCLHAPPDERIEGIMCKWEFTLK